MRISLEWLKEYVPIDLRPEDLAELLTQAGLEVENLTQWRPEFQGVVPAKLVSFRPLPGSDHLAVCRVNDGQRDYSIVCGAPNLHEGDRVVLAREGATLPGGQRIGKTSFQGVPSEGMLCSEKELGLSNEASGIMILPQTVPMGTPLEDALGLGDWILDINVTPNRSDCLCLLGIAREIAALLNRRVCEPVPQKVPQGLPIEGLTSVEIQRPDLCARYVAELVLGVRIAPSPFWMRRRLEAVGIRSINNIVDVTNYVMMEMGQPLHAFDSDLLEEHRIVVRAAERGESFTTLDGVARALPGESLMICDGKKPVALAGIMGGQNSEIQPDSVNILLESAYFDPMGVRRTSKRTGLSTEASLRFERGIDPNGCLRAADRAAALMAELGGGQLARGAVDNYPRKINPAEIPLRVSRTNQILGTTLPGGEVRRILENLQLDVETTGPDSFRVVPPTFRVDLHREIDLIEEVARLHGFQRIPVTLPGGQVSAEKQTRLQRASRAARDHLAGFGLREVINYSFISPRELLNLRLSPDDRRAQPLRIDNPLGEDQSIMRTTLIPALLQNAVFNFNRQNMDLKFFELGRVFLPRREGDLPEEIENLGILLTGLREEESWAKPKAEVDFFDLKGLTEGLFAALNIEDYGFIKSPSGESFLHPGRSCGLAIGGEVVGAMGQVHPDLVQTFKMKQSVFLLELNFAAAVDKISERRVFKPIPRFPAVTRDLALIIDENIPAGEIFQTLREAGRDLCSEIRLFDLYRGNPIPAGKKSLAFHLKYQREDRTLTDDEVNEVHQNLVNRLAGKFGALLR